jgi:hypothetical protein
MMNHPQFDSPDLGSTGRWPVVLGSLPNTNMSVRLGLVGKLPTNAGCQPAPPKPEDADATL